MKKVIALLLAVILILSFTACSESAPEPQEPEVSTEEMIETLVAGTLLDVLSEHRCYLYGEKGSGSMDKLNSAIDPGHCRMSIGSTSQDASGNYIVYGSVATYDKYGDLVKARDLKNAGYELYFKIKVYKDLDGAEIIHLDPAKLD